MPDVFWSGSEAQRLNRTQSDEARGPKGTDRLGRRSRLYRPTAVFRLNEFKSGNRKVEAQAILFFDGQPNLRVNLEVSYARRSLEVILEKSGCPLGNLGQSSVFGDGSLEPEV